MKKQDQELLKVEVSTQHEGTVMSVVVKNERDDVKTNIGRYGFSFSVIHNITGNCQISSVSVAHHLTRLSFPQFIELMEKIVAGGSRIKQGTDVYKTIYKSSLLIDVHKRYVDKLDRRFKRIGAYTRLKTNYKNRTGSNMTMMVIDLRGPRFVNEGGDE